MKRSTKRIFIPAHFTAAVVVALFSLWLHTKFPAMNWSSPWLWGFLAIFYVMIAGPFVAGATVHETAKYVTDGPFVPSAPPPPSRPRRPMPKALKIIGIASHHPQGLHAMTSDGEEYLGDGLYVSTDGWQIKLRAPRDGGDHEIYLDQHVLRRFIEWLKQTGADK